MKSGFFFFFRSFSFGGVDSLSIKTLRLLLQLKSDSQIMDLRNVAKSRSLTTEART